MQVVTAIDLWAATASLASVKQLHLVSGARRHSSRASRAILLSADHILCKWQHLTPVA